MNTITERHEHEQYFFDAATRQWLADRVSAFERPCCLCAPTLGRELAQRGIGVRVLDIDARFADLPGFRFFDLVNPAWLGEVFGVIVCDPPFFNASLRQLAHAIRLLSRHDPAQPLLVTYLQGREGAFLRAFADFGLQPTGFFCGYDTVEAAERNAIQLYANVPLPQG